MKRITEDYCSYDVAKLLKKKGFDECSRIKYCQISDNEIFAVENEQVTIDEVYIPTHQMAMKWLREVHKLFVDISFVKDEDRVFWYYAIFELSNDNEAHYNVDEFTTYEEAVDAALKYSLENLI